jgi:hypothetical protein
LEDFRQLKTDRSDAAQILDELMDEVQSILSEADKIVSALLHEQEQKKAAEDEPNVEYYEIAYRFRRKKNPLKYATVSHVKSYVQACEWAMNSLTAAEKKILITISIAPFPR